MDILKNLITFFARRMYDVTLPLNPQYHTNLHQYANEGPLLKKMIHPSSVTLLDAAPI